MSHDKLFQSAALLAVVGTLAGAALPAAAQSAGSVLVRVGATQIKPNVDSGDLSPPSLPGTKASVRSDTQLGAGLTYMVTDNIAVDIPIATPFTHELDGDGAISGVGKIGETKALPITVMGQYRFLDAKAPLRPYVGAGVTYAKFYKAQSTAALSGLTGGTPSNPTTLSIKSKFAATIELGASYTFNDRWFVDATVLHTFLKTRATLSTGQTLDMKLDPDTFALAVGYKF
ncbi:MAG TPA: OmpW family outer membrane protein [Burkholderiaceae bacterium]|nr:OmpW family outer membrane protein [Burkholderiaceae bacterium]